MWGIWKDLQNTLRQVTIVLFCNLCSIRWPLKNGRVVVNIFNMYHDSCVVFFQVIRRCQAEFILVKDRRIFMVNLCFAFVPKTTSLTECKSWIITVLKTIKWVCECDANTATACKLYISTKCSKILACFTLAWNFVALCKPRAQKCWVYFCEILTWRRCFWHVTNRNWISFAVKHKCHFIN